MNENDFLDPSIAAYFASMEGTPALALYRRWKAGETIKVRLRSPLPGQPSGVLEIWPERFFESGPVTGVTVLVNGEVRQSKMRLSDSEFLEWAEGLKEVE